MRASTRKQEISVLVGSLNDNNSGTFSEKMSTTHYDGNNGRIGESVEYKRGSDNSDNTRVLQRAMTTLVTPFERVGLTTNTKKTKAMN